MIGKLVKEERPLASFTITGAVLALLSLVIAAPVLVTDQPSPVLTAARLTANPAVSRVACPRFLLVALAVQAAWRVAVAIALRATWRTSAQNREQARRPRRA